MAHKLVNDDAQGPFRDFTETSGVPLRLEYLSESLISNR